MENILDKTIHNNISDHEFSEKIRIEKKRIKSRTHEEKTFLIHIKNEMRRNQLNFYSRKIKKESLT
jgi:hypothetical protein